MSRGYQKIELHSSYDLAKDKEIFDYEKNVVENLLRTNGIQYTSMIQEQEERSSENRFATTKYVLSILVKIEDVDKVVKLLDEEGTLGYYLDLEARIEPMDEVSENPINGENDIDLVQSFDDDPIKNVSKTINISLTNLFLTGCFFIFFMIIIVMEIYLMVTFINMKNYEAITGLFIVIVCELPIFISILKTLSKKKGE